MLMFLGLVFLSFLLFSLAPGPARKLGGIMERRYHHRTSRIGPQASQKRRKTCFKTFLGWENSIFPVWLLGLDVFTRKFELYVNNWYINQVPRAGIGS